MPTLLILCGLPFSGKTVIARRLNERYGFPVVCIDEIKFAHGFPWIENSPITAADWDRIFTESYDRTRALLREGKTVVYDCANLQRVKFRTSRGQRGEGAGRGAQRSECSPGLPQ